MCKIGIGKIRVKIRKTVKKWWILKRVEKVSVREGREDISVITKEYKNRMKIEKPNRVALNNSIFLN